MFRIQGLPSPVDDSSRSHYQRNLILEKMGLSYKKVLHNVYKRSMRSIMLRLGGLSMQSVTGNIPVPGRPMYLLFLPSLIPKS